MSTNRHKQIATLFVQTGDLKMLREHLAYAQSTRKERSQTVANLIAQIDVYRPLGSDGSHGERHTLKCGCEDK